MYMCDCVLDGRMYVCVCLSVRRGPRWLHDVCAKGVWVSHGDLPTAFSGPLDHGLSRNGFEMALAVLDHASGTYPAHVRGETAPIAPTVHTATPMIFIAL